MMNIRFTFCVLNDTWFLATQNSDYKELIMVQMCCGVTNVHLPLASLRQVYLHGFSDFAEIRDNVSLPYTFSYVILEQCISS